MAYENGHINVIQSLQLARASVRDYILNIDQATPELEAILVHVKSCKPCAKEYVDSLRSIIEEDQTHAMVEVIDAEFGPDDEGDEPPNPEIDEEEAHNHDDDDDRHL